MLVNPQLLDALSGNACMVAMLYFSEDGKNVELQYYSTHYKMYYREANQFSFTVHTVERGTYPDPTTAASTTKPTVSSKTEGTVNTAATSAAAPSAGDKTAVTTETSAGTEASATDPAEPEQELSAEPEESTVPAAPSGDASQTGGDVSGDKGGPGVWLWIAIAVVALAAVAAIVTVIMKKKR